MVTQKLSMRAYNGWTFVNILEDPPEAVKTILELMSSFEDRFIAKKLKDTKISSRIVLDHRHTGGELCRESCIPYSLKFVDLDKDYIKEKHTHPFYFRNFPGLQMWDQNDYELSNEIKKPILEDICEVANKLSLTDLGKFRVVEFPGFDEKKSSYCLYVDRNGSIINRDDIVTEVLANNSLTSPFSIVFSKCGPDLDKLKMQDFWSAYSINFNHGRNEEDVRKGLR